MVKAAVSKAGGGRWGQRLVEVVLLRAVSGWAHEADIHCFAPLRS